MTFTYRNPAGLAGITKVKVKRLTATPGLVQFTVKGRRGGYVTNGVVFPLRAVLALGAAGQGGLATLTGSACTQLGGGNVLNCK